MYILFVVIHVIICVFLIIVVLLQSGKAADLAGAFGGMGSQTAFGPRGAATVLSKATTGAAIAFMVTSITLSIMATRMGGSSSSVLDRGNRSGSKTAPGKATIPPMPALPPPITIPVTPGGSVPVGQPPAPAKK